MGQQAASCRHPVVWKNNARQSQEFWIMQHVGLLRVRHSGLGTRARSLHRRKKKDGFLPSRQDILVLMLPSKAGEPFRATRWKSEGESSVLTPSYLYSLRIVGGSGVEIRDYHFGS